MRPSSPHFFPLAAPILLALFLVLLLLIAFVEVGVIGYAYEKIGIDRRYVFTLLMLPLIGSYVPHRCSRTSAGAWGPSAARTSSTSAGSGASAPRSCQSGGAGTFDGTFLTGILAVLLA
jgi:uncharacterized membrane protein